MDPIVFNTPTVSLKDGGEHKGSTASLFRAADGSPLFVQVRKSDHYVTLPWGEVAAIVSV